MPTSRQIKNWVTRLEELYSEIEEELSEIEDLSAQAELEAMVDSLRQVAQELENL